MIEKFDGFDTSDFTAIGELTRVFACRPAVRGKRLEFLDGCISSCQPGNRRLCLGEAGIGAYRAR